MCGKLCFKLQTLRIMSQKLTVFLCSLAIAYAPFVHAQDRPDPENPENENLAVPVNWKVRMDRPGGEMTIGADPDEADIYFVNMVPGWHITTGPAAIFWHPGSTAEGTYRAEAVIHLFDPQGRNEAFGIFTGGSDLEGEGQVYSYFLLRNSGEFLIKNREGSSTGIVKNWSDAPPMNTYIETTGSSVENVLAVEVRKNEVAFFVNGTEVATVGKAGLYTDGIVGLRINHRLNVHVEDLAVTDME